MRSGSGERERRTMSGSHWELLSWLSGRIMTAQRAQVFQRGLFCRHCWEIKKISPTISPSFMCQIRRTLSSRPSDPSCNALSLFFSSFLYIYLCRWRRYHLIWHWSVETQNNTALLIDKGGLLLLIFLLFYLRYVTLVSYPSSTPRKCHFSTKMIPTRPLTLNRANYNTLPHNDILTL